MTQINDKSYPRIDKTVTPTPAGDAGSTGQSSAAKPKTGGALTGGATAMSGQEFLTLLVNQLQAQDPLNPMDSQEFAVQLAQFSQVEQLIGINDKLSEGGAGGMGSLASYLGNEVVLDGSNVNIKNGKASNLLVDVPDGTASLRVDLLDKDGKVVASQPIDQVQSGSQVLSLKDKLADDGSYGVRVVSVGPDGKFADLKAKITGTVEGFIVSPEQKLIVGGEEVSLDQVKEVHLGKR